MRLAFFLYAALILKAPNLCFEIAAEHDRKFFYTPIEEFTQMNTTHSSNMKSNRLGTFGGVFTLSILTILGVIMFMRAGLVVGQAGILYALLILLLAKSISSLTALSISAVSTNAPVSGGRAYFLTSRSLGPEFGGAIGIALFCAQAISVPFYTLGFTEVVVRTFPDMKD